MVVRDRTASSWIVTVHEGFGIEVSHLTGKVIASLGLISDLNAEGTETLTNASHFHVSQELLLNVILYVVIGGSCVVSVFSSQAMDHSDRAHRVDVCWSSRWHGTQDSLRR